MASHLKIWQYYKNYRENIKFMSPLLYSQEELPASVEREVVWAPELVWSFWRRDFVKCDHICKQQSCLVKFRLLYMRYYTG
jgi:hypothetical protein